MELRSFLVLGISKFLSTVFQNFHDFLPGTSFFIGAFNKMKTSYSGFPFFLQSTDSH